MKVWDKIMDKFCDAFNLESIEKTKLQSLWKRIKAEEKSAYDKQLLAARRATNVTGGGPAPIFPDQPDPDIIGEVDLMQISAGPSGLSTSQFAPCITPWQGVNTERTPAPNDIGVTVGGGGDILSQVVTAEGLADANDDDVLSRFFVQGEQEDSNPSLPSPTRTLPTSTNTVTIFTSTSATPTVTVARTPRKPAAAKSTAYVESAGSSKEYWAEKLQMERLLHNSRMELLELEKQYHKEENERKEMKFQLEMEILRKQLN